jgi:hypothetical protein
VYEESRAARTLWAMVLAGAVVLLLVGGTSHPLIDTAGGTPPPGPGVTVWIAGADAGGELDPVSRRLARDLRVAGRHGGRRTLPGGTSAGVADFLSRGRGSGDDLLLVASGTFADIARDRSDPLVGEARDRARRALRLLPEAAVVGVVGDDPLVLAVPERSPIRTAAALLARAEGDPSRPVFGLAEDSWAKAALATLLRRTGLHGRLPYRVFPSAHEALLGLDGGTQDAVLAPRSALRDELRSGRLRAVPWPGPTPRSTLVLLAPPDLSARRVAALRAAARRVRARPGWRRTLLAAGLRPATADAPRGLARRLWREAAARQAVVDAVVRPAAPGTAPATSP